jgi:probable F420-dependent oxidoreductase
MQFSVYLPQPTAATDWTRPDVLAELACEIERIGFDACAVIDHPFPYLEDPRAGGHAFDIFAMGGFLAAATTRVRIHLNVIVMGYRNPFVVARAVSSIDHLAEGRLLVAFGAGYMQREFAALGGDFALRNTLVDEGVVAMKAAWTGEPVTLDGTTWSADGNTMLPRPYTQPHPPLIRGGNTTIALRSAARHFDGWSPFEAPPDLAREARTAPLTSLDQLRRRVALLRDLEREAGRTRPLEVSLNRPDPRWLERPEHLVREDVVRLEQIGVTRLVVALPGSSREEFVDELAALAAKTG